MEVGQAECRTSELMLESRGVRGPSPILVLAGLTTLPFIYFPLHTFPYVLPSHELAALAKPRVIKTLLNLVWAAAPILISEVALGTYSWERGC